MDRTRITLATGPSPSHLHSLLRDGGWGVELQCYIAAAVV